MYYRNNSVLGAKLNLEIKSIEIPPNFIPTLQNTTPEPLLDVFKKLSRNFYAILASKVVSSDHALELRKELHRKLDLIFNALKKRHLKVESQEEVGNVIEYICRGQRTIKGLCFYMTIVAEIEELKKKKRLSANRRFKLFMSHFHKKYIAFRALNDIVAGSIRVINRFPDAKMELKNFLCF